MKKKPPLSEGTRVAIGMQIYDTNNQGLSVRACEKLAGLKHPVLQKALARRELKHAMRCPTCGLVPGEKLSLERAAKQREEKAREHVNEQPG